MTKTTTIGDAADFAIENRVRDVYYVQTPIKNVRFVFGDARIWAGADWVGDIDEGMTLNKMCEHLRDLRTGRTHANIRRTYPTLDDVRPFEELRGFGGWSWGEAYDAFPVVHYAVLSEQRVHFIWELCDSWRQRFPDYPSGIRHKTVDFGTFDDVVGAFLDGVGLP